MKPSTASFNYTVNCLEQTYVWKPLSKILLIFENDLERDTIVEMFRLMWKQRILNVVVISNNNVIGFNPFFDNFYEILSENVFYDKLKNLNGFILNLLLRRPEDTSKVWMIREENKVKYLGKDGFMISSILGHINAKFNVIVIDQIYGKSVNPWRTTNYGMYEHMKKPIIENHSIDLFFDSTAMDVNDYTENLYPHAKDDLVIFLPKPKMIPQIQYLMILLRDVFSFTFVLFLLICPLVSFIFRIVANRIYGRRSVEVFYNYIFRNLEILLGISTSSIPKFLTEKLLFFFILFCCLIVNTYFQSILKSILTISIQEPEIHTLKELSQSKIEIMCSKNLQAKIKKFFVGSVQMSQLPNFVDLTWEQINNMSTTGTFRSDSRMCMNMERFESISSISPVFYVVKERLLPNWISVDVVKNSPYREVLEKNVMKIIQSGMYAMWNEVTLHKYALRYGYKEKPEEDNVRSIDLYRFRFSFYLIGIGCSLGLLVFILEILWNLKTKRNFC